MDDNLQIEKLKTFLKKDFAEKTKVMGCQQCTEYLLFYHDVVEQEIFFSEGDYEKTIANIMTKIQEQINITCKMSGDKRLFYLRIKHALNEYLKDKN